MARNETESTPNPQSVRICARAPSWRALASVAVASALLLALFVSVLSLLEAAFPNPQAAQRSRPHGLARERQPSAIKCSRGVNPRCSSSTERAV